MSSQVVRTSLMGLCALISLSTTPALSASISLNYFDFRSLHPDGAAYSAGFGIAAGTQVGAAYYPYGQENIPRAVRWSGTAESVTVLDTSAPSIATATDGTRHAGSLGPDEFAASWTGDPASQETYQSPPGVNYQGGTANAVSGSWVAGSVQRAGGSGTSGTAQAALWAEPNTAPTLLHFGDDDESSTVWGIANTSTGNAGQQVGEAEVDGAYHAILWNGSASNYVDLNPAGAAESTAYGISDDIQVGYYALETDPDQFMAAFWNGTAASVVSLHPTAMLTSLARAVWGSWAVGDVYPDDGIDNGRAALWDLTDPTGWIDLSELLPSNYARARATGIEVDGNGDLFIIGSAINLDASREEAVYWYPSSVPIPSPLLLAIPAVLMLLRRRR